MQAMFLAGLLENVDRWGLSMALAFLDEKAAEDASIARLLQAEPQLREVRSRPCSCPRPSDASCWRTQVTPTPG